MRSEPGATSFTQKFEGDYNLQALEQYYQDEMRQKGWEWYNGLPQGKQDEIKDRAYGHLVDALKGQDRQFKKESGGIKKELYQAIDTNFKGKNWKEKVLGWIISRSLVGAAFAYEAQRRLLRSVGVYKELTSTEFTKYLSVLEEEIVQSAQGQIPEERRSVEELAVDYQTIKGRFEGRGLETSQPIRPLAQEERVEYYQYRRLEPIFEPPRES